MSGRQLIAGYFAVMAALATLFFGLPGARLLSWTTIGLVSAAAVAVGVRRHQPGERLPWLLLAAALAAFTIGDATWLAQHDLLRRPDPVPTLADLIYLAGFFPLAMTALVRLARTGLPGQDRESLLDTLILTTGLAVLAWSFLIRPYVGRLDMMAVQRAVLIGYPVFSVLILATVTRLAATVRWSFSVIMLVLGGCGLLVADVMYGLAQLTGEWAMGGPVDLGWMVLYASWGAAALHPSMARLTEPRAVRGGELTARRWTVLAAGSLTALAVLLVDAVVGPPEGFVIAVGLTAVMFALVLTRLAAAVDRYRQAIIRERGLREAGAALVSTTSVEQVGEVVRAAVGQLLSPGTPHRVELAVPAGPSAARASGPDLAAYDRPGFLDPAGLDPALTRRLDYPTTVWYCPITLAATADQEPEVSGLYVAAAPEQLVARTMAVAVLAAQAALALARIRLTEEINRRANEAYFRTLVHNTADVILILADDDTIRYASPSARVMFGTAQVAGCSLHEFVQPEDATAAELTLRRLRDEPGQTTVTADWAMVGAFSRRLQAEALCRNLCADPTVAGLVVTLRDVTEQRRMQRELTHRAFHDSLTGLANRVLLQERMERAVIRSRHNGAVAGLLFVDLDDFKVINDTMGHTAGDELLVAVSNRLKSMLRPEDTAARLGGDEFGVLVEDARRPEEIDELAQRLVAAFTEPFSLSGLAVSGAVSVGVATTAEGGAGHDLLRQADLALYVAKGAGKGQWRRYRSEDHAEVLRRMELRAALSRGVADGSFLLAYQPIVELATGRTVGMEALVRWYEPSRGAVPPGEFIEAAEESGLIVPIGAWVLKHALADAAAWRWPDRAEPYLSVNVSARQFRRPEFVADVRDTLATVGLPPGRLVMEITESVLMHDEEQVWADLTELRELGVRVAIDDFGTGYSSLRYLGQLPIDIVKIEKSFVGALSTSPSQLKLVEGILGLAHTLGLEVVAEGIEHTADRDLLLEIGCRYGQGYLFAKPLSYRDAVIWMNTIDAP